MVGPARAAPDAPAPNKGAAPVAPDLRAAAAPPVATAGRTAAPAAAAGDGQSLAAGGLGWLHCTKASKSVHTCRAGPMTGKADPLSGRSSKLLIERVVPLFHHQSEPFASALTSSPRGVYNKASS
eukprot:363792-Pelagomonas_calceolata.AAC.4